MIESLIDKQDNFEIVRDEIAAILALEVASQMQLATDGGEDPEQWKLRIFSERSNPWEQFTDNDDDKSPLVNIWFDNMNFDQASSNISERQKAAGQFNIDCYGYAISSDVSGGGHIPGDRAAALEAQRAVRLVRNILMSAGYTYLGLRGLVWQRWIGSISVFQPEMENRVIQNVVGARVVFSVGFSEFAPQIEGEILEFVSAGVSRTEDGQIVINADYDFT